MVAKPAFLFWLLAARVPRVQPLRPRTACMSQSASVAGGSRKAREVSLRHLQDGKERCHN
jgi:hypothetical protein